MKTDYMERVHKWGKARNFSMLVIMLMFPMLWELYSRPFRTQGLIWPDRHSTYVLGRGNSRDFHLHTSWCRRFYLSFVTGNISNLKLPAHSMLWNRPE